MAEGKDRLFEVKGINSEDLRKLNRIDARGDERAEKILEKISDVRGEIDNLFEIYKQIERQEIREERNGVLKFLESLIQAAGDSDTIHLRPNEVQKLSSRHIPLIKAGWARMSTFVPDREITLVNQETGERFKLEMKFDEEAGDIQDLVMFEEISN